MDKVMLISTEFPPGPGGIGSHAYSLTKALIDKHIGVVVFAGKDYCQESDVKTFDEKQPFDIYRFKRNGWRTYICRIRDVSRYVSRNKPKRIILSGKFSLWLGLWLRMRFFYRHTYMLGIIHGSEVNPSSRWERILVHLSMAVCSQLVAVSRYTKAIIPKWVRKHTGVVVIPNGIDCQQMAIESKNEFNIDLQGSPVLLTVGGVTFRKGQHRVIKALPEILKFYPQACYHIVGLPVCQKQFKELALQCGVDDHVVFHGVCETREELANYYKSADIFMLLSENQKDGDVEGFGIVALEAGYFSLPVIGAMGCGVSDAVDNGFSGYLVDGNNAKEIQEAISMIHINYDKFCEQSKTWAEQHDWRIIIDRFIKQLYCSE